MRSKPGTFPWLLAHDMQLNWRRFTDTFGKADRRVIALLAAIGTAILILLAWPAVRWLSPQLYGTDTAAGPIVAVTACTFAWMIAQSLFGTTRALYDRGDLDLLLGSPLSSMRVFASKAAAIAASTFGSIAVLTLPIAIVGALIDRAAWFGVFPILIALTLLATAVALVLSIGLFFLIGPRRARVFTHMTGAVIGGVFILAAQVIAVLPKPMRDGITNWLDHAAVTPTSSTASLLWLPIAAVRGDVGAMALLLGIGGLAFAVAIGLFANRFANASLAAAGAEHDYQAVTGAPSRLGFRAGLGRSLRRKEWRLLARDPSLFSQLGLQIIYTIPVAVVLMRSDSMPAAFALAPTIVVVAAQVAASLAWITVSGEDAPELIASAPVAAVAVDRAKLSAVALPVFAIVGLPLLGLALISWRSAAIAAVFAVGAATSTALLNFWHPMPGNRRGMLRRHSQSKLVAMVEHALAILWAIGIVFALIGNPLAIVPIALVIGVLVFCRTKHSHMTAPQVTRYGTGAASPLPSQYAQP